MWMGNDRIPLRFRTYPVRKRPRDAASRRLLAFQARGSRNPASEVR